MKSSVLKSFPLSPVGTSLSELKFESRESISKCICTYCKCPSATQPPFVHSMTLCHSVFLRLQHHPQRDRCQPGSHRQHSWQAKDCTWMETKPILKKIKFRKKNVFGNPLISLLPTSNYQTFEGKHWPCLTSGSWVQNS